MGAKQTKIEGTYLSDLPTCKYVSRLPAGICELQLPQTQTDCANTLDPRSPNGCRTPINMFYTRQLNAESQKAQEKEVYQQHTPVTAPDHTFGALRKRFFKGFIYNLNDPRSPSSQLNRTPMIFDEAADKTLNLDDTFADLFVETQAITDIVNVEAHANITHSEESAKLQAEYHSDEMQVDDTANLISNNAENFSEHEESAVECCIENEISSVYIEEDTMLCTALLPQTPAAIVPIDPRSPTIGVDRTPLIFSDDDETSEEAMLETILATLSLDLSNTSSLISFGTPPNIFAIDSPTENMLCRKTTGITVTNKHLERVRVGKKHLPKRKLARAQRQRIYEDDENAQFTPKHKTNIANNSCSSNNDFVHKRTPLSCVKNRANMRSRSVETSSLKTLKARLSLTSFDDTLNPVQNAKVNNLSIMQDSQEFL